MSPDIVKRFISGPGGVTEKLIASSFDVKDLQKLAEVLAILEEEKIA